MTDRRRDSEGCGRLISFLGTGNYEKTTYLLPDGQPSSVATRYMVFALASMLRPQEVVVVATEEAEKKHGPGVQNVFDEAGMAPPAFRRIKDGRSPDELWDNFGTLRKLLDVSAGTSVALDITHGFRSQPFFAAAVVGFAQALAEGPLPVRILYGAFDAKDPEGRAPVWDLTVFAELVHWSNSIGHFLRTGDARAAADRTDRIGSALSRGWFEAGRHGAQPMVRSFATALREFGEAFVTVRVAELLLERAKGERPSKGPARAKALNDALGQSREDLRRHVPPIGEVLDRVERMVKPLVLDAGNLGEPDARRAVAALARLYWQLGRYAEAAAVLREGWVNLYASPDANRPGSPAFNSKAREDAERRWYRDSEDSARDIGDVRNDIEHAGFRSDPLPGKTIRERLDRQIEDLAGAEAPKAHDACVNPGASGGTTYFVTRHPGARDWAADQGFKVDEVLDHLDPERVGRGDTVIGSLPVNLAAEVCNRGGRYLHLSIEVPRERRGTELTAEDMRLLGARVQEYYVSLPQEKSVEVDPSDLSNQ